MDTKYIFTNEKGEFICFDEHNEIYISQCLYKAFCSSNIQQLISIFNAIPPEYTFNNWYIENYSHRVEEQFRYDLAQNQNKNTKNKTSTKSKRIKIRMNTKKKLFDKYNGRCAICGKLLSLNPEEHGDFITVDHIVPLDKGGKNVYSNYQATCCACNLAKTNIMPEVFKNSMKSVLFTSIIEEKEYQDTLLRVLIKIKIIHFAIVIKSFLI
ncbi:MAG TPA: HNH endonuclease [Candidatus Merdenecus merdavium]|nr:HNH endonuclease [Candidatus Merdenecus merdavium]